MGEEANQWGPRPIQRGGIETILWNHPNHRGGIPERETRVLPWVGSLGLTSPRRVPLRDPWSGPLVFFFVVVARGFAVHLCKPEQVSPSFLSSSGVCVCLFAAQHDKTSREPEQVSPSFLSSSGVGVFVCRAT